MSSVRPAPRRPQGRECTNATTECWNMLGFHKRIGHLLLGVGLLLSSGSAQADNFPSKPVHILWFDYPANVNALYALVSFATSGIYLAFFLTVFGALIARRRGWKPSGTFTLGRWGVPITLAGAAYLFLMLLNIVWPSALSSGRAVFNYGWITLLVMAIIVSIGALYEAIARPDRRVAHHRIELSQ